MMARRKWTAAEVLDAIRAHYGVDSTSPLAMSAEEWSLHVEVPLRERNGYWASNERRIDALVVRNWTSAQGHERIAFEVKVSKSDYRNETDLKRAPAEHAAHRCYYATPPGLLTKEAMPEGWGLVEVNERTGRLDVVRKATRRTPDCDLDYLVAALGRIGSRATERLRRGATAADRVPTLEAEVERLGAMIYRRDQTINVLRERLRQAKSEVLRIEGAQECADCHRPMTWSIPETRLGGHWAHTDKTQDRKCMEARREAARRAQEARTGARYLSGYAGPPEPVAVRALWAEEYAEITAGEATG